MIIPREKLSQLERDVLDFEASFPQANATSGARERTVDELLELTPTRYSQILAGLLDSPEAYVYAPMTMKRLRARAERRMSTHSPRASGVSA